MTAQGFNPTSYLWYSWFRSLWEILGWSYKFDVHQSCWLPAESLALGAVNRTAINGAVYGVGFPAGADTLADGSFLMPNNYKDMIPVALDLIWCPTTANTNPMEWRVSTSVARVGEAFSAALNNVIIGTPSGVAFKPQRSALPLITGLHRGSVLKFSMGRYGATGADTYAADIVLLGVSVRYRIEGIGHELKHPSEV
jgi:hypothetical protein